MKIKFIVPSNLDQADHMRDGRIFPPMALAKMKSIASATHTVSYLDERTMLVNHDSHADVVVIFISDYTRFRAYTLAKSYRASGSYVVFTGAILEKSPEDAFNNADCLFIGSGEEIMPRFLADIKNGRKRRLYGNMLNPIAANEAAPLQLVS